MNRIREFLRGKKAYLTAAIGLLGLGLLGLGLAARRRRAA